MLVGPLIFGKELRANELETPRRKKKSAPANLDSAVLGRAHRQYVPLSQKGSFQKKDRGPNYANLENIIAGVSKHEGSYEPPTTIL